MPVWQLNVAYVCIIVLEVRHVGRSVMLHVLSIAINGTFRNQGVINNHRKFTCLTRRPTLLSVTYQVLKWICQGKLFLVFHTDFDLFLFNPSLGSVILLFCPLVLSCSICIISFHFLCVFKRHWIYLVYLLFWGKEYCIVLLLWELPTRSLPNRNTSAQDLHDLGEASSLCSQGITLSACCEVLSLILSLR